MRRPACRHAVRSSKLRARRQTGFSRDQNEEAVLYSKLRRVNI
jgi:hypothetical protein